MCPEFQKQNFSGFKGLWELPMPGGSWRGEPDPRRKLQERMGFPNGTSDRTAMHQRGSEGSTLSCLTNARGEDDERWSSGRRHAPDFHGFGTGVSTKHAGAIRQSTSLERETWVVESSQGQWDFLNL